MVTRFVERCECASNADRSNIACWPDCGCLDQLADFPYLFWIWSGDCSRLARKFELEGGHDALDDLCHPVGHVAIGNGYVLYAGWVYSHPLDPGDRGSSHPCDSGPHAGLEKLHQNRRRHTRPRLFCFRQAFRCRRNQFRPLLRMFPTVPRSTIFDLPRGSAKVVICGNTRPRLCSERAVRAWA